MASLQLPDVSVGLTESEPQQQQSSAFSLGVVTALVGAAALFAFVYLRRSRKSF